MKRKYLIASVACWVVLLGVLFTYNAHHRPLSYTDAAGQTTSYAYNAAGQLTSLTNPLGQTTSYQYDAAGDLTAIVNANSGTAASFTYDAYDRVATFTDSEGWSVAYSYDAADRVTAITYPDGTADLYSYDKLDLASYQDRQIRTWRYSHDADRRLSAITDPVGNRTLFAYNGIGELTGLTDPNGNATSWSYDVEGRLTGKTYADSSTVTYTYETTTSRLLSVLDALGQTKQYSYAGDDRLAAITYLNAANSTPNVTFAYDLYFPRLISMTDGNGTTQYAYVAVGALGALRLQQESSPLLNSAIAYVYDALGRLSSRTVTGAGAETFGYDAIGRLVGHANDLGSFALSYLGQTGQITQRQLASSTLATSWSYLPNSGDRRLAGIANVGLSPSQYSTYAYTTTPENFIAGIAETSDSAAVYPTTGTQTAAYNNVNALTTLSGGPFSYDANGNLLADGLRTYQWDAESRLVGIGYPGFPGQTGKATTFAYDGLGRRTAITSTLAGGGPRGTSGGIWWWGHSHGFGGGASDSGIAALTTNYLWCGARICQARNAYNAPTREYYAEGELVLGEPALPYYYGPDQLGTVRRAFASTSSAPAYSYDPYGVALQATAPVTDFNYAGTFYNADSGLYLTRYRAYNPAIGRWLSRDPVGESSDPAANLYRYVNGNPVSLADPSGSFGLLGVAVGALVGGSLDLAEQLSRNNLNLGCVSWGEVAANAAFGAVSGALPGIASATWGLLGRIAAREAAVAAEEAGTAISTFRYTQEGESFFHYGYESQAENFAEGLRPGGYATDIGNLSAEEAQSGLALPRAAPPDAVYTINPESGTLINVNPVVRPQFGQPGGLTEFQFPMGTGPGTVSGPGAIP